MNKFKKYLIYLWCKCFHKKYWHNQTYTDRATFYERIECWQCESYQSKFKVKENQNPYE